MIFLDANGKTKKLNVANWTDGLEHHGRFNYWCQFNLNPMDDSVVISASALYMGAGADKLWHIHWS